MDFNREISRLLIGLLTAFLLVTIAAAYWALIGEESLLLRGDNPRLVEEEATLLRGSLLDREGTLLAQSIPQENGLVRREYLHPAMYSALGYFSLRYGAGGIEAAFNSILRGDTLPLTLDTYFEQDMLHRPRRGSDVRLTLSLEIQQAVETALGPRTGAAVILAVPDGEVLALVSHPAFDPNTLDTEWDKLVADPGKPFFNRVLQGVYQPGGMLQTPLMAAAILTNHPLDTVTEDAAMPVQSGTLQLTCAVEPPAQTVDFTLAYAYGCPRPFRVLAETLGEKTVADIFAAFRLSEPSVPAGFSAQPMATAEATPEITPEATPETTWLDNALGQGSQTINPLSMAGIVAAIVNQGNAPQPYFIQAVRAPETELWQDARPLAASVPMITIPAARRLGELMIANVQSGTASPAHVDGLTIGGHAALAYSGETTQSWFIGFVMVDGNRSAVIAVVLENSRSPAEAAAIGGMALQTAFRHLSSS